MTTINGVRLPAHFNGIGCHDTPGCYAAVWDYATSYAHAQELKAHGVTCYKLFVSGGNKVERARAYVDAGLLVMVRFWVETPWGRPPAGWVTPGDQIAMYANVGVQLFEPGWNEFNIAAEWVNGNIPNAAAIADAVCDAWEVGLSREAEVPGTVMLFPSNTPGGNVDHRLCYQEIAAELGRRGLTGTVRHIAVHPRPHNNPPDTLWTATNTVTFDEWRWIRDRFPASCYLWATEHGYSIGDDQNHTYPKIDLTRHTDYNWALDLWMDPTSLDAIEPQLAGFCHWFEAGWGAWGAWPKDSLRDSIVPEMPAPSPLWIRMGDQAAALNFERHAGDEPPEPPADDTLRCFDSDGNEITWDEIKDRWGQGLRIDTPVADEYWKIVELREDKSGSNTLLIGAPPGTPTMFWYSTAPALPTTVNREWATVGDWMAAKPEGRGEFGLYNGAFYDPLTAPYRGPHAIWCGAAGEASERFVGIGWVENHWHPNVKYAWHVPTPEPPQEPWRKPFDGDYAVTCDFQCHKNRVPPSTAPGVDYACPMKTPMLAVADGVVYAFGGPSGASGRWIELVCLVEGEWYRVTYRHLDDRVVRSGQKVTQGQVIGHSGNTGNSTGPHLHCDTRTGSNWAWVDPETLW